MAVGMQSLDAAAGAQIQHRPDGFPDHRPGQRHRSLPDPQDVVVSDGTGAGVGVQVGHDQEFGVLVRVRPDVQGCPDIGAVALECAGRHRAVEPGQRKGRRHLLRRLGRAQQEQPYECGQR